MELLKFVIFIVDQKDSNKEIFQNMNFMLVESGHAVCILRIVVNFVKISNKIKSS